MALKSDSDSMQNTSMKIESEELCCPICLEEFEDPKILPYCKHNVCRQCLENMTRRKPASLLCPVCRCESSLSRGGVRKLATNTEVVKLVEESKDERQKERLLKVFEASVQKMADANKLLDDYIVFSQRRQEYGNQLKEQIHNMAEQLVSSIREKEGKLYEQVDKEAVRHEAEYSRRRTILETFTEDSRVFISKVEDHLNESNECNGSESRKVLLSESEKIIEAKLHGNVAASASFDEVTAKFSPNMTLLEKIEKEGLGRVYTTNSTGFPRCPQYTGSVIKDPDKLSPNQCKPLEAEITIRAFDVGLESFSPLSLATNGRKYIAVADPANGNVLILDKYGNLKRRFKPPLSASGPVTFSGVAFTKVDELIAVSGSTEVYYLNPEDGSFKMSYKTNEKHGIRYCFITIAADGRILLTCEPSLRNYRPCIFVYNDTPFGKPDLKFGISGDYRLEFPFKAIYHDSEYFVSDMEKGCILVYDSKGKYRRHFGGKEGDGSGQLVLPTGMTLSQGTQCLYICDWGSSSIQVYTSNGNFIAMFMIEGRPTDIVILDSGTVVVSSKDDQWIKFYTFPQFCVE